MSNQTDEIRPTHDSLPIVIDKIVIQLKAIKYDIESMQLQPKYTNEINHAKQRSEALSKELERIKLLHRCEKCNKETEQAKLTVVYPNKLLFVCFNCLVGGLL